MTLFGQRLVALVISLPILALFSSFLVPTSDIWQHLLDTTFTNYLNNSLLLGVGVALISFVIGTVSAWLCTMCQFPGRQILRWAMVLPLAFPPYIVAYTYTGMIDYGGWFNSWWREVLQLPSPTVRSLPGAILVLSFVLYPYVYLLTRAILLAQSRNLFDAARLFGLNAKQIFVRLVLPIIRPAAVAGIVIVVMESLADYATVKYFGVQTLSVGIFRVWLGLGNLAGAAQLSLLLLIFTILLIVIEKSARQRIAYYNQGGYPTLNIVYHLRGSKALLALTACVLPVILGFVIPAIQLIAWAYTSSIEKFNIEYLQLMKNSLLLGIGAAVITVVLATIIAYGRRLHPSDQFGWLSRLATSGYALPGVVITIGVIIVNTTVEQFINKILTIIGLPSIGLFLSGTIFALLLAYAVRFMTLGFSTVESTLVKVAHNIDYAAQSCGANKLEILKRIHLPLMRPALLTAILLVFVETIKELPATLVLRPLGFNTLAVRAYELASNERLADIALPALSIVAISLLPIILLVQQITRQENK